MSPVLPDPLPTVDTRPWLKAVTGLGDRRPVVAARAIYNTQGLKLIDKGVRVDSGLYEKLSAHVLRDPIEESLATDPTVTITSLCEAVEQAGREHPFFARLLADPRVHKEIVEGLKSVNLPDALAFRLAVARELRPDIYEHGVLMVVVCAWLAWKSHLSRQDVSIAAAAALLHDLGMLHIDPALLASGHVMSAEERKHLYAHPVVTVMLLRPHHGIAQEVLSAVLQHHERLDGIGYPRGLSGEQITPLGRILSLAEMVTAMFAHGRSHPQRHVALLLRLNQAGYDPDLVRLLGGALLPEPPEAAGGVDLTGLMEQLQALVELSQSLPAAGAAPALQQAEDELATLRRQLWDAGVSPEYMSVLMQEPADQAELQSELAMLLDEGRWQMRAVAERLRRRWPAGQAMAAELVAWLDAAAPG